MFSLPQKADDVERVMFSKPIPSLVETRAGREIADWIGVERDVIDGKAVVVTCLIRDLGGMIAYVGRDYVHPLEGSEKQ